MKSKILLFTTFVFTLFFGCRAEQKKYQFVETRETRKLYSSKLDARYRMALGLNPISKQSNFFECRFWLSRTDGISKCLVISKKSEAEPELFAEFYKWKGELPEADFIEKWSKKLSRKELDSVNEILRKVVTENENTFLNCEFLTTYPTPIFDIEIKQGDSFKEIYCLAIPQIENDSLCVKACKQAFKTVEKSD